MTPNWIPIILLAALIVPAGGCLDMCGPRDWGTSFDWAQSQVFETFPNEGHRAGYNVTWGPSATSSKGATKTEDGRLTLLVAYHDGKVHWGTSARAKPALSDEAVRAELNRTFADLGIRLSPIPSAGGWDVKWNQGPC